MRLLVHILLTTALALGSQVAHAEMKNDAVDWLGLAALLTRDGAYERAEQALANVDPAGKGVDRARYFTVRGTLELERQHFQPAAEAFAAAIAAGQSDPLVHVYLAQALLAQERYDQVLAALDRGGDAIAGLSGTWLMRAHAQWMSGARQAALDTLTAAAGRFPGNYVFQRRQVFYLIEAGLNLEAAELGRDYLRRSDGKPVDYVAIGTALRRAGNGEQALRFLEAARLRFPDDIGVRKALAQAWLSQGDALAAAEILADSTRLDPSLNLEAAELFRRAGQTLRALRLNAAIADSSAKLKQRIGLLIQLRRYDEVTASEAALARSDLLTDEDVRYALAYAWYRIGHLEDAERHLRTLTRPDLFRKATELRRLMQECNDARWTCA